MITSAQRQRYRSDGFVALRGVLPVELVHALGDAVDRAVEDPVTTADMSALGDTLRARSEDDPDRGRFRSGVDHWRHDPEFRAFALESPLPGLVADLLESRVLHLYEDSVLVKEPNTREPTVFHQDLPYFSVDGESVCTTWVPLDRVTRATGAMGYVRGSHLDRTEWRPNLFVSRDPVPGSTGTDVPDLHLDPGDADIVWVEAEPGDVVVHHARTLHGAGPNTSAGTSRRAVSVRYCGDDATYASRSLTPKPHHDGMTEGELLRPPAFPVAWPRR